MDGDPDRQTDGMHEKQHVDTKRNAKTMQESITEKAATKSEFKLVEKDEINVKREQ